MNVERCGKKCHRTEPTACHAGQLTKEENAVFPILHIWRMQKRKHRMEENGTEKEKAALKYRERNEEKLRADARSTEQNLYKSSSVSVRINTSYCSIGLV